MNLILRYRWHRMLYDWYTADDHLRKEENANSTNSNLIILDADDLMYNPPAIAELCKQTGLDYKKVKWEWRSEPKAQIQTTYEKEGLFIDALANSTGVLPGKGSTGVKPEVEGEKWIAEFGTARAQLTERRIEDAMEDYLCLRQRSLGYLLADY